MKTHIMVTIWPDEGPGTSKHGGFCKGMYLLCKNVEKCGSLLGASKALKMAYSKAWELLNEVESDFGFQILDRRRPTGSTLTDNGKRLMKIYEQEVNKCLYHRPKLKR